MRGEVKERGMVTDERGGSDEREEQKKLQSLIEKHRKNKRVVILDRRKVEAEDE